MELGRVVVQPATPDVVVRSPRRDERPEARTMTEHTKVSQFVADDGLERLRRGKDQAP